MKHSRLFSPGPLRALGFLAAFAFMIAAEPTLAATTVTTAGTPPPVAYVGSAYSFVPKTPSQYAGSTTFSISHKPAWAAFNTRTGALTGTPKSSDVALYSGIVISAVYGKMSGALPTFSITVKQSSSTGTSTASLTGTPPASVAAGSSYSFTPNASGLGSSVSFSVTNRPS